MKSERTRSEPPFPISQIAEACVSRPSAARLLRAPPATDLGALMGELHARVWHGASDADTAAAAAQICRMLGALSIAEIEILEKAARGMPASSAGLCPACEDEDAAPVGFVR
jgi:hypothetical protein